MTLHPIAVVDQVLEEYRSYLFTEFRARDRNLRAALEAALDEPRFLAKEPFFLAHRPFKPDVARTGTRCGAGPSHGGISAGGVPLALVATP